MTDVADFVTLIYHEARNVRHLVRAGAVEPTTWKYLVALPTNRNDAWVSLQGVRQLARAEPDLAGLQRRFDERFHVDLGQLEELYGHPDWRNSSCGGNAWLRITQLVRELIESIDRGHRVEAGELRQALAVARHNTGTVAEKLRRLDETLNRS